MNEDDEDEGPFCGTQLMNNCSQGPSENSQIIIENPELENAHDPVIELKKEETISPNKGKALNKKQLRNLDLDDIFN